MSIWEPIRCLCWWTFFRDSFRGIDTAEFRLQNGRQGTITVVSAKTDDAIECDVDLDGSLRFRAAINRDALAQQTPGALLRAVIARTEVAISTQDWPKGTRHPI